MGFELKDSGERREFATGAQRDGGAKGAWWLLPYFGLDAVAIHTQMGAEKYSPRNWEKGLPLSTFVNSGARHVIKTGAAWVDENHPAAWAWNGLAFLQTVAMIRAGKLPRSLDDIGYIDAIERAEGPAVKLYEEGEEE